MDAPDPARPAASDDARLAEIVAGARATRRPPTRAMWIAAAIVGVLCAVGFVLLFVAGGAADEATNEVTNSAPGAPSAASPSLDRPRAFRGTGCAGGLGLGLAAGLAIGFWLGRRQGGDHSSRSRP